MFQMQCWVLVYQLIWVEKDLGEDNASQSKNSTPPPQSSVFSWTVFLVWICGSEKFEYLLIWLMFETDPHSHCLVYKISSTGTNIYISALFFFFPLPAGDLIKTLKFDTQQKCCSWTLSCCDCVCGLFIKVHVFVKITGAQSHGLVPHGPVRLLFPPDCAS